MIQCNNIYKTYPKQVAGEAKNALKGISFTLYKGQTLGLVGPNGAGKSTTIRLIMDFIRPDSGNIQIMGQANHFPELRKKIGYLPETANFLSNLSCLDMLKFAGKANGMKINAIKESGDYWLNRLGLFNDRNRPLRNFSKGMQQRASFVLALMHNPKLLILDEPMSGLDPIGRAQIIDLIKELRNDGKSILLCSHILHDIERLTDALLVLHHGKLLFNGSANELKSKHSNLESAFLSLIHNAQGNT